ncbi:PHD domain-containing protein/zf-RING_2 domain-containing protein [Cephalotus follicularis]|uniref:PHD domain-containing protein/zf-RING_2 domain-containing protein n=1 Tax=Cephalotus follicularis TaxID=3775 RepID=A0A1Q3BEW1_CEPFO|nr:PHD domain-containing protein/zf-RING_2 domain-containing protein [Cephalotus follicularis]
MGRGGKVSCKRNFKRRTASKDKESDDSDEDYVVSNEENEVSDDESVDYCSILDGDASEENFSSHVEEEEQGWREVRKVSRSKARKSGSVCKGENGSKTSKKRKRIFDDEEDDDEDYEEEEEEDTEEEFTPDEDDCLDEDEEPPVTKKKINMKVRNTGSRKKGRRGRKRKTMVTKKNLGKKERENRRLRKKVRNHDVNDNYDDVDGDFVDHRLVVREKRKKNRGLRKRRSVVQSDSDFGSSGSSDFEYTISEEEREQVREANQLFESSKSTLRSSSSVRRIQEVEDLHQPRKHSGRKGKEKIEELKHGVARQVCGICLSEEDKRRSRGTLDCCSHFFCFTCIMEWSKVESRCPLCKQRFRTITKPARSMAGVDLRNVVIPVPERDQVYQPSEEELRSYLDPYENVICSECHEGGDDALMLLCDQCDSSAHTYCVGLGRQVPEGNWYCDGCRPVALGSSSSQAQDPLPNQRTTGNNLFNSPLPTVNFGEGFDPNSVPSPRIPFNQGLGNLLSPRFPVGNVQAASPVTGAGAPTLSGRRWIHRQIQNLLSINRMGFVPGRTDGISTDNSSTNFLNSRIDQGRELTVQHTRTQDMGPLHHTLSEERVQDNPSSSLPNRNFFSSRLSHLRRQAIQDINPIASDRSTNLALWPEPGGFSIIPGYEQLHQSSNRSSIGSDGNLSPYTMRAESQFYIAKEQLQSMVKSHLKNLSRDVELGNSTFKDIARSSTHTILAACGLEHRWSEVHTVPPPPMCTHVERVVAGQTSLMKGFCTCCFDSFVRDVVKRILDTRLPQWLSLGL